MSNVKDIIIAKLKVKAHKWSDVYQLYQYNRKKIDICSINKRMEVWNIAREYNCNVLIETGTYLGEMIEFQQDHFEKIYSIEISEFYYNFTMNRLKEYKNINILHGDSESELGKVIDSLSKEDRVIFWLDGHYSGGNTGKGNQDSPIIFELETIIKDNRDDIILIDDARCFVGKDGYPDMKWIKEFSEKHGKRMVCYNDIIRILPRIDGK